MTFHISVPSKLDGNTLIHPEIEIKINKGNPVAIQMEPEFFRPFLSIFSTEATLDGAKPFTIDREPTFDHLKSCFVDQKSDGLYIRLTPRQILKFWKNFYGSQAQLNEVLSFCELTSIADKRVRLLNESEARRLQLARSLIMPSLVCVFDQPTHHVDRQTKQVFEMLLKRLEDRYVLLLTTSIEQAIQMGQPYQLTDRGLHSIDKDEGETETPNLNREFKLEKISAKVDDKIILFDPMELDYIESLEGQTLLHVNGEIFQTTIALKDLEVRLVPFGFFRCHRSYLVNLQRVREIIVWSRNSYSLSLKDKKKSSVPLSKGNYSTLKELLNM